MHKVTMLGETARSLPRFPMGAGTLARLLPVTGLRPKSIKHNKRDSEIIPTTCYDFILGQNCTHPGVFPIIHQYRDNINSNNWLKGHNFDAIDLNNLHFFLLILYQEHIEASDN